MRSFSSGGGVETMLPHDVGITTSNKTLGKRKAFNTEETAIITAKRVKNDNKTSVPNKRKLGEEMPGGLRIIRASSKTPSMQSQPVSNATITEPGPSRQSAVNPSTPPRHPSKKFKATSKQPEPSQQDDGDLDAAVAAMLTETDTLRRSRSHATTINSSFLFPGSSKKKKNTVDMLKPIPDNDTPTMERNRHMRNSWVPHNERDLQMKAVQQEYPDVSGGRRPFGTAKGPTRRKSSITRGKRASTSFENGVISQPHKSVSDASFYKHIDADIPAPLRARQLLIWLTARGTSHPLAPSSSSRSESKRQLSAEQRADITSALLEDTMKQLIESEIDTTTYSANMLKGTRTDDGPLPDNYMLEGNSQNIANRVREAKFAENISRMEAEDRAWSETRAFYSTYASQIQASSSNFKHNTSSTRVSSKYSRPQSPSATLKGKERVEDLQDLELEGISKNAAEFTKDYITRRRRHKALSSGIDSQHLDSTDINGRMASVQVKVDRIHSLLHTSHQALSATTSLLDGHYHQISLALVAQPLSRTSITQTHPHLSTTVHIPPPASTAHDDPQNLFRALAAIDSQHPPATARDRVIRAAKSVRDMAKDGTGEVRQRRLTATGIFSTPKKGAGTPGRRPTTPKP